MNSKLDSSVYAKMQTGEPLKRYKKTILGKVYVMVLNPFSGEPEGKILSGDPKLNKEECIVEVWSEAEDAFFRRSRPNRKHLEDGVLILYEQKEVPVKTEAEIFNTLPDEELNRILDQPFYSLQSTLEKMTSEAAVYRVLNLAREKEKSEKIIHHIEAKLSELQSLKFAPAQE